jgi:hypothetical protein
MNPKVIEDGGRSKKVEEPRRKKEGLEDGRRNAKKTNERI